VRGFNNGPSSLGGKFIQVVVSPSSPNKIVVPCMRSLRFKLD
jgi:hypothetical protein